MGYIFVSRSDSRNFVAVEKTRILKFNLVSFL